MQPVQMKQHWGVYILNYTVVFWFVTKHILVASERILGASWGLQLQDTRKVTSKLLTVLTEMSHKTKHTRTEYKSSPKRRISSLKRK